MTNLLDAEFYITEYSVHKETTTQFRTWLKKLILPFISDSHPPILRVKESIPAPAILLSVIKTLRQFPEVMIC